MSAKIKIYISNLYKDIHNMLFPKICVMCGILLNKKEKHLCIRCLNNICFSNSCFEIDNFIEKRIRNDVYIKSGASLFNYDKKQSSYELIYLLKYKNRYDIGKYLGMLCGENIKNCGRFENIDYIIPVPVSQNSYKKRGYNQSLAICEGIKSIIEKPICENILLRKKYGKKQSSLSSYEERIKNAENTYYLNNLDFLKNKNILLVDDIITSGSTIVNCTKTLQQIENINIYVFSIAAVK